MNFTVYSKRLCPWCEKVKKVLGHLSIEKGFPVVSYELGEHFSRMEFIREFGDGSTFPQVMVNDRKLGGCVETIKYLQENKLI
jgi:glutaredoxin